MFGSLVFYSGIVAVGAGIVLVGLGFTLAAGESQVTSAETRLDEFMPRWQFRELHNLPIEAPPERVYEAIRAVRADEIRLFRTLTWLRRFGRPLPESILNAGDDPLIDVATRSGFIRLADDAPQELVIGTIVVRPRRVRHELTPQSFKSELQPGFAIAAMNFLVRPDGKGGSLVSTETRVFANSARTRRRFARYWRVIYPGSALIRRMWLRAVRERALSVN